MASTLSYWRMDHRRELAARVQTETWLTFDGELDIHTDLAGRLAAAAEAAVLAILEAEYGEEGS